MPLPQTGVPRIRTSDPTINEDSNTAHKTLMVNAALKNLPIVALSEAKRSKPPCLDDRLRPVHPSLAQPHHSLSSNRFLVRFQGSP
jgi:hypothetical protein